MDFLCRVKIFHRSLQIVFFPTTQHPKVTFDRAQVLEWVLRNNCNWFFFSSFLDSFDYPKLCPSFEVVERGSE